MKTDLAFLRQFGRLFRQNWANYLFLLLGINFMLEAVVIPLLTFLTSRILAAGQIPYVSYTNLGEILIHHPFASLALLLELVLLIGLVYFQFSFLLLGIVNISHGEFTLKTTFKQATQRLTKLNLASLGFLGGYFVLIMPFANLIFKTPLLSKVTIPAFIVDFLLNNPLFACLLGLFYLGIFYLGLRLLLTLPLMIIKQVPTNQAVLTSWNLTKKHNLTTLRRMFIITICVGLVTALGYMVAILLQVAFDNLAAPYNLLTAILLLALLQFWATLSATFVSFLLLQLVLSQAKLTHPTTIKDTGKHRLKLKLTTSILLGLMVASSLVNNYFYLHDNTKAPLRISHRGVDNGNGVQNTLPALAKTTKLHPDFVEMDLHETKDHQFVVMHDENLKNLTGVNKAPHQLTLKQLTKLTARENGHQAKIVSFDDYLAAANRYHQKLLIEIKTTKFDSPKLVTNFLAKYQTTIKQHHHQIHSLDYRVVAQIKKQAPTLFVSYILPYNFAYPNTNANAYSMEESTLNESFIINAYLRHQRVYAWTVNTETDINKALWLNVDGIITDNLSTLDSTIAEFYQHPSYADKMLNYLLILPYDNSIASEASA